jgi:hypothetical protein
MLFRLEAAQAIEWTTRLIAFYVLLDAAEKLYNFREFASGGVFDWTYLREQSFFARFPKPIRRIFDALFARRTWLAWQILRALCAAHLLFSPRQSLTGSLEIIILFAIGSLANLRQTPYGAETENRFSLMIFGALMLRGLAPTPFIDQVCLWFIALQVCLSYATAGVVKLSNEGWRGGEGLFNVVNSSSLIKSDKLARFFSRHQKLAKNLTWLNVAIECVFPLVLLVGKPYFLVFLLWGVAFHSLNAAALGLNKFLWAWIAAYPALIFCAGR